MPHATLVRLLAQDVTGYRTSTGKKWHRNTLTGGNIPILRITGLYTTIHVAVAIVELFERGLEEWI